MEKGKLVSAFMNGDITFREFALLRRFYDPSRMNWEEYELIILQKILL